MNLDILNFAAWKDFVLRGIFLIGVLGSFILIGMQVWGWELTIGLPRIESTFKHRN